MHFSRLNLNFPLNIVHWQVYNSFLDFINDNKIGVGATIELIRSGDVIPYIRKVIVPAEEPRMPSISFKWNASKCNYGIFK